MKIGAGGVVADLGQDGGLDHATAVVVGIPRQKVVEMGQGPGMLACAVQHQGQGPPGRLEVGRLSETFGEKLFGVGQAALARLDFGEQVHARRRGRGCGQDGPEAALGVPQPAFRHGARRILQRPIPNRRSKLTVIGGLGG